MNQKVLNVFGAIQDVAKSIAKSDYGQAIFPGKTELASELNQTIAGNVKLAGSLYNENIQKSLVSMFQTANIPEAEAIKMAKKVNVKNYDEAIDALRDDISQYTDKPVDKVIERAKMVTQEEIKNGIDPESLSTPDKIKKYPVAYFMNPDKKIATQRAVTAVATYAGVNAGGRFLTGGTLTEDKYGRKDIAGIPFL